MELIDIFAVVAILAAVAIVIQAALKTRGGPSTATPQVSEPNKSAEAFDLASLASELEPIMEKMAHPGDILGNKDFKKSVAALASTDYTIRQASNYALGSNWVLSCIGYEALSLRDDSADVIDKALKSISNAYAWPLYFLMRFVKAKASQPVGGQVLCGAQYWWQNNPAIVDHMTAFFEDVLANGEEIIFGQQYTALDSDDKKDIRKFIDALPTNLQKELKGALDRHEREAVDQTFLRSIGEVLGGGAVFEPVFETEQIGRLKKELLEELESPAPRSILLVGNSGVGKTALSRTFAKQLIDAGWTVLRTSASALIADKVYIGQIEGQVRRLAHNASVAKHVTIYVENMLEFSQLGRHKGKDSSVLDQLWPDIESRKLFLISETTQSGLQALLRGLPSLPTVMKVMPMNPTPEDETLEMATKFLQHLDAQPDHARAAEVVSESLQLAQQYLSYKSLPGSVLSVLELAVLRAQRDDAADGVGRDHLLGALSQISGLPRDVLDEKQKLDIKALDQSFRTRVIGQDEAVECLVERIAMLKAGLTDPSRPIGVFLFAGPTGTGKTEIAKTLAELLFGSNEQMIRLDMSEFQDPDSGWRLTGRNEQSVASGSLVSRIREKPFSVVLLDEFEKAHVKIWDMFLQVFDDGRLTDTTGEVADFRHAIIILTSNLGATIANEAGVGFTSAAGGFSARDVMRTINRTFRREFVNRLDRVVVFRPLNREVMRTILRKELDKALGRRGLRTKQWAVEWEDSAIEFLLAEGFTPDLGARPLRRSIERHLLAPLSITMVQNQVPAGEQFLFVRSNGEALQVEFIDPDADAAGDSAAPSTGTTGNLDLPTLIISTSVPSNAADYLASEMAFVAERVEDQAWIDEKSLSIEELNKEGFWSRSDRYLVLDRIELIDRLDSAASVLMRLSERLQQHPQNTKLVRSIANRLYVLQEGLKDLDLKRPTQAYLGVRLVTADVALAGADEFLHRLIEMYRNWAKERGMRLREIDATTSRYDALFTVSGFGSYGILRPESGLHVFEIPKGPTQFDRIRARVEVAGVPVEATDNQANPASRTTRILDDSAGKVEIVRRYRQHPSPLARDSVRGWRTGKLETVLGGNFDLLAKVE